MATTASTRDLRSETDFLGSVRLPRDALWGAHTARATQNFGISGITIGSHPELIVALAQVKQAASRANRDTDATPRWKADLIDRAAQTLIDGNHHQQFIVDVLQGGAGTSTNMNANEVIANVALQLDGRPVGDYDRIHPIDDVNRSQSTNDTYPTAAKIALHEALRSLVAELGQLASACASKGDEFRGVLKIGRTQLQDAVPMTLGQEFTGFSVTLNEDCMRLEEASQLLLEVNIGATAIGTGITADDGYAVSAIEHLSRITGLPLVPAHDLIEATSDAGVFMTVSGVLKRSAMKLSKICNDLRLLGSGPQAGFGEITLPPRQAGSSIMPGKVNPVIPEVVNQVAFTVAGTDLTVTMAAESGQLQLNAFEPVMVHSLLQSIRWLKNACQTLRVNCIDGIRPNAERLHTIVESNVGVVTALIPHIGYSAATELAYAALQTKTPIRELAVSKGLLTEDDVSRLLEPLTLTGEKIRR